jgi:hypothetical protein
LSCSSAPQNALSEAEFSALAGHYDEAKIFEIILLCGFCRTVSVWRTHWICRWKRPRRG